jgi:hypothetical protein
MTMRTDIGALDQPYKARPNANRRIPLMGRRFGRLVVTEELPLGTRVPMVVALCDCGVSKTYQGCDLRSGHTKSCGCLSAEVAGARTRTHGLSTTRTYKVWAEMLQRCANPKNENFQNYGGRGISVCDRWRESFENFLADMGERPTGTTLDRKENDGNYEPSNCRWATRAEQARNNRRNINLTFDGVTKCLTDWCLEKQVNYNKVRRLIHRGMSPVDAWQRTAG